MLLHKSVEHDSRVRREGAALAAAGHEVTVVELAPPRERGLDGFACRSAQPPGWLRRALPFHLYRVAFLVWFVVRIVQERPDVVHAHDAAMLLPGGLGARLARARLVYDSHELATGVPYRERAWAAFVELIERLVVPRCEAVITVSDGIAQRLQDRYALAARPAVLRNVCDLPVPAEEPVERLRDRLLIDDEALILHQGAAAPARGCETLVRALARLPRGHLVFLGDGEPGMQRRLSMVARAEGVRHRVHFVPSVPLSTLLAYTREADVGVTLLEDTCENHRLALPNKLFEYISAGVPVVASDLPEIRRIVGDGGLGWTVDPSDPEDVADGLARALEAAGDPELDARLEAAARSYSWSRERERLIGVYAALSD